MERALASEHKFMSELMVGNAVDNHSELEVEE
jgi:hypothetical protein